MSSRVVDKIDPFLNKASIRGRKQKRSQGSSHYRTKGPTELTALPHLKGEEICGTCTCLAERHQRILCLPLWV